MSSKLLLTTLLLLNSGMALAENHLLVFGGGGEPAGNKTIFDTGMVSLGKNLKKANWKYEVSFNGGHKETESILRKNYSAAIKTPTDFTDTNYDQLIKNYKERILSGSIKSGDQLMIIINTHGAAKDNNGETHKISAKGGEATDLNNLSGSKLVSLDPLGEIVKLANEKGIKLGIVDLSCHSGNTLALKKDSPNLCIVTATGPNHYGFAGPTAFTDKFLSNLTSGTNLEEAFLKARLDSNDASFPMITTNANNNIVKDVYENITPYLYYYSPKTDKMTGYITSTVSDSLICKREENFAALISKIDQLSSVVKSKKNGFNAEKLKTMLIDYKKLQDKIIAASDKLGANNLKNVETFDLPPKIKAGDFKAQYTWKELLELDIDKTIAQYETYKKFSQGAANKAENQAVIDFLVTVKAKKDALIKQYPNMNDFQKLTKEMVSKMEGTREMADKIALQEKQFYEESYRLTQDNEANNPCRNIVF